MRIALIAFALTGAAALAACAPDAAETASTSDAPAADAEASPADGLDAAIAGDQRSADEKARDQYRHPKETLMFFGAEPDMTIVEIWPGGGWYANVIAPYLASGGGTYYAAGLDPASSDRARSAVDAFEGKYGGDAGVYGDIEMTALSDDEIAPAGVADMVLTFRNVHNWMGAGAAEENFRKFYAALKPGGVLGVVEHRADESASAEEEGETGYVKESTVKAFAKAAGFDFDASSEINANPKDTKDHPFGVWTLPPVRRSSAVAGVEDPEIDRAKYDAIGESDRMTLRFKKPIAADGALLQ